MKNFLITGGAGFIGSNFIHFLLNVTPDIHITNLDALTYAGNPANNADLAGDARYEFVHGNICDQELVKGLLRKDAIDTVVHFAAESHVDRSIAVPLQFIETNIVGTAVLLEAVREVWQNQVIKSDSAYRFHHISTDEVYGSLLPEDPPFCETTPYAPSSPYSASKAASDHLVRAYHKTYNLPVTITNCSNNYGPYQFPEKLIPLMILNACEGKALPVYGDGLQVRDWLYVEDHCSAIMRVLQDGKIGETYNIGGNNQPPNLQIIETICAILDEKIPNSTHRPHRKLINYVTDRPGHDRRYAMDIHKISTELGWQPRYTLEEGLKKTIDWYLSHPEWVDQIRGGEGFQGWLKKNYQDRGIKS